MSNEKNHGTRYFLFYHIGCISLLVAIWWVGMAAQQHRNAYTLLAPIDSLQTNLLQQSNTWTSLNIEKVYLDFSYPTNEKILLKTKKLIALLRQSALQVKNAEADDLKGIRESFFRQVNDLAVDDFYETDRQQLAHFTFPSGTIFTVVNTLISGNPDLLKKHIIAENELIGATFFTGLRIHLNTNDGWFTPTHLHENARRYGKAGEHFFIDLFVPGYHECRLSENLMVNHQMLTPIMNGGVMDTIIPQAGKYRLPVVLTTAWGSVLRTDTLTLEVFEQ